MKTTQLYRNSKGQYVYTTKWKAFKFRLKQFIKKLTITSSALAILALAFYAGQFSSSVTIYASPVEKIVLAQSPVLDRIADCESGNGTQGSASHFSKSGQVTLKANTNGTVDVGRYQINSVWFKKATELGLDITKEADNKKMAEWIYANKGTGDWQSSAHCWNK